MFSKAVDAIHGSLLGELLLMDRVDLVNVQIGWNDSLTEITKSLYSGKKSLFSRN